MAGSTSRKTKSRVFQKRSEKLVTAATVRTMLNQIAEKKVFITGATNQTTSASGTVWAITQGIVQGDSVASRDGSQITLDSLSLRIDAFMPTAAVASGVRVIVVSDSMNNGATITVGDVLNSASFSNQYSTMQFLTRRFTILADQTKNMTAGGVQQVLFNMNIKLKRKVYYNGTTDAPASNGKNSLFMIIITDSGATQPSYDFTWAVRYLDV